MYDYYEFKLFNKLCEPKHVYTYGEWFWYEDILLNSEEGCRELIKIKN